MASLSIKKQIPLICFLILVCALPLYAQRAQSQPTRPKITQATKSVEGIVSAIYKMAISVVYNIDVEKGIEREMLFHLDETVGLKNRKTFDQINFGDTVRVEYIEVVQENDGKTKTQRLAKTISFLKPAPVTPEALNVIDTSDTDMIDAGGLNLKGMKGE
ncbi:MAG: hypothetical protein KKE64_00785 [Candidatus Omnitrophica bacterium]|nr:hypothetical protein [Candidatus Omnitrophota bacterium]